VTAHNDTFGCKSQFWSLKQHTGNSDDLGSCNFLTDTGKYYVSVFIIEQCDAMRCDDPSYSTARPKIKIKK